MTTHMSIGTPRAVFSIEQGDVNAILTSQLKRLLNKLIAVNSTAFEDIDPGTKQLIFVGSNAA